MKKFYFDLQMFKGKGGSTTTYTMSPEERQLLVKQMGYLDEIYPNMIQLNKRAGDILWNSFADTQYDFNTANKNAQQQISNAQQGLGNLTQGQLPQAYTDNMTQAIQSGVQNSVGNLLNTMGNNGVINSSVTNQGMNDISKNVANTMANQFTNNVQTLGGLYNDQISNAGQGITLRQAHRMQLSTFLNRCGSCPWDWTAQTPVLLVVSQASMAQLRLKTIVAA